MHPTRLGSTAQATDYTGAVAQDQIFYPWGQEWQMVGAVQEKRFARLGHRDSTETGLDPTFYRAYSSTHGRWLGKDQRRAPIGDPQGLNRYTYASNSPVIRVDMLGLDSCSTTWFDGGVGVACDPLGSGGGVGGGGVNPPRAYPEGDRPGGGGGGGGSSPGVIAKQQQIAMARTNSYVAMVHDENCVSFLNSAGVDCVSTLPKVPIQLTGFSGADKIASAIPTPGVPTGYVININEAGPFFETTGSTVFYPGGPDVANGSPRFQGFVLLHELGHVTGVLPDEGHPSNQAIENANNAAIASHCKNAISSLSNTVPH